MYVILQQSRNNLHTCGLIITLPFGVLWRSVSTQTVCSIPCSSLGDGCSLVFVATLAVESCLMESPDIYGVDVGDGVTDSERCDWVLYPELEGLSLQDTELAAESGKERTLSFRKSVLSRQLSYDEHQNKIILAKR